MQSVNKSEDNFPAEAETDIPLAVYPQPPEINFCGWTQYGYWHNGQLLNRPEYNKQFGLINPTVASRKQATGTCDTGTGKLTRSLRGEWRKSWRKEAEAKHAARSHHKGARPLEIIRGMPEYHIPTLNDLAGL